MTAPDPLQARLPLSPRQARGPDLARRRRARARKATGVARIGHSGTLDPMATGLLLLCAGGAARLQGFFTLMDKSYEGVDPARPRHDDLRPRGRDRRPRSGRGGRDRGATIEAAAAAFRGEFLQSPPPYSAKKVGGRQVLRDGAQGREPFPRCPRRSASPSLTFGAARGRAASRSRSPAPRAPTSARSRTISARGSAAAPTSRRCAAPASESSTSRDAVTLERFEALPAVRAPRGAPRRAAVPRPLPLPAGPARLARGLEDPPGTGGPGPRRRRPGGRLGHAARARPTTCWPWARSTRSGTGAWPDSAPDRAGGLQTSLAAGLDSRPSSCGRLRRL